MLSNLHGKMLLRGEHDGRTDGLDAQSMLPNESAQWGYSLRPAWDSQSEQALASTSYAERPMLRGGGESDNRGQSGQQQVRAEAVTEFTNGTGVAALSSNDSPNMALSSVSRRALHEEDESHDHPGTTVTAPPSVPVTAAVAALKKAKTPPSLPGTTVPPSLPAIATAQPSLAASGEPVVQEVTSNQAPEQVPTEMPVQDANPTIRTEPPLASGGGIKERTEPSSSVAETTSEPAETPTPEMTTLPSNKNNDDAPMCNSLTCKVFGVLNEQPTLYPVLLFVIVSFCCCLRWKLCRKRQRDPRGEYRAVGRMLANNFDTELSDEEIQYTYDDDSGDEGEALGGWSKPGKGSIELRSIGNGGGLTLEEMNG
jgi:hypothetical protein